MATALVQYIVVRRDLLLHWGLGAIIAQACHASSAALWQYRDDPNVLAYVAPDALPRMRKVVLEARARHSCCCCCRRRPDRRANRRANR